jgi:microcystin-dependent protein/predicted acyltransferase (DUF342 family)
MIYNIYFFSNIDILYNVVYEVKRMAINRQVLYDNRLTNFTTPPITTGDLYVKNNQSVNTNLTIGKDLKIGGGLNIAGDLNVGRNETVGGYLSVTGDETVGGDLSAGGDLSVTGSETVGGTLSVTGNTSIAAALSVTGSETVGGTLSVTGNTSIAAALSVTGNETVGGTLSVTGNTSIAAALSVTGNETVGGTLDVSGNIVTTSNITAVNHYAAGNYYLNNFILIPSGSVIQSAAINVPNGWLDCAGQSLLVSGYPGLFAAISYTYGGSGANFNLPDLRGRAAIGVGTGVGLSTRALGNIGGVETHTLSLSEIPSHSHTIQRRINPDAGAFDPGNEHADESSACTTDRALGGNFSTAASGSGGSHQNMQPFIALRYLIKI